MTTPSAIDYTSRDYAGLRESMLAYARTVAPDWGGAASGDPNDFGVALIEIFAYLGDILSYYGDRNANEAYLSTATRRQSVLSIAQMLDYTPRSATAASTPITFTVTSTVPVVIPAGFEVATTPDGVNDQISFQTDTDLYFPGDPNGGSITLSVSATEGDVVNDEVVATSCGDLDATFTLQQSPVVAESLQVRVVETPSGDGLVWFRVNNLLDAGPSDLAYSVVLDEHGALTVRFGDGVNGRVPPRGAVIHASYRVGGGSDGNVLPNTITTVSDPSDVVYLPPIDPATGAPSTTEPPVEPATPIEIVVTNQTAATGGTDAESLESIRINAPRALRAHDRAVTLEDFEALALSVPTVQIAKAKAVSAVYTNVTVYVAPPGGTQPDQATLNAVVAYLSTRHLAGVTVVAATPQYVSIDVTVDLVVDPRYAQLPVRQAVNNVLSEFLAFDNVSFGGRISLSDIYGVVRAVPGVLYVTISKLARNGQIGATDVVLRENELPISGQFTLAASGGVVNTEGTEGSVIGTGTATPPTASSAPMVSLLRCDPNSTHVELEWTAGAHTTFWDVVVSYRDLNGAEVERTTYGPFANEFAVLDLPLIGAGRASRIAFSTNAYNGAIGPVGSPSTQTPYTCEGNAVPSDNGGGGGGGTPTPTTHNAPQDVAWQPIQVGPSDGGSDIATLTYAVVQWTTPANPPTTHWVSYFRFLDGSGNPIAGGQASGPQQVGTTSTNFNGLGVPPGTTQVEFWLQVVEDDSSLGAESNHAIAQVPAYSAAPTLSGSVDSGGTVSLSWTAVPGAIGYTVFQDEQFIRSYGPANGTQSATSASFAGNPGLHNYTVRAYTAQTGSVATATYGPDSNTVTLNVPGSSGGGGGGSTTTYAGTPSLSGLTNKQRSGPSNGEYTVSFTAQVNLAQPFDQVAMLVQWQPQGYTDQVVFNASDVATGDTVLPYSQQYTDANSFTSVTVTVTERKSGSSDSSSSPLTVSFP